MTRNLILDPLEESNNLLKNERDDLRRRLVEMERENAALRKRQEYGPFTPGESQVNPASPPAGMEPRGEDALSALAGSEQRMRSFIESMNDLIFVLDHDLTIREYHAPRDDALYVPAEHFLGKNVDAVGFPEPAGAIIKDALIQALQSGKMTRAEYYLQEAKGLSWFDLKITLFEEKKDPQTYLTCVVRDITAYKQAEIKLRESEKQYRMLFETSMDGILLTSPDGRITAANPAACSMVGMTEAELIQSGRPGMVDLSDPSNRAALEERARSGYFKGEMTFIRKDGTRFPAELSSVIYQAADGEGQQSNIIFRDISERKRIEEALKSEQFLVRTVIDNIPDQIFVRDRSCRFILNNLSDARMMGVSDPETLVGKGDEDFYPVELAARFQADNLQVMESGQPLINREELTTAADGEKHWLLTSKVPLRGAGGKVIGLVGIARDITQRKQVEAALRESEGRFRSLFEQTHDAVFLLNLEGRHILCNQRAAELFGYGMDEMLNLSVKDTSAEAEGSRDYLARLIAGENIAPYQRLFRKKDGQIFPAEVNVELIRDRDGQPGHIQSVLRDISERKHAEEALRENEEKYRRLFNAESDAIYLVDNSTGQILEANAAASTLFGYSPEEMLHRVNTDFSAEPEKTLAAAKKQQLFIPLRWYKKKDGTLFPVEISAAHLTLRGRSVHIAAIRDISERMRQEKEIREKEQDYRLIINSIPMMIWFLDVSGKVLRANPTAAAISGTTVEDIVGASLQDVFTREDADHIRAENEEIIRSGQSKLGTIETISDKNGQKRWVQSDKIPYLDEKGQVSGVFFIVNDIHDRKTAEDTLRVSEERYRMLVEQAPEAILVYDVDMAKIVDANRNAEKLFGYSRDILFSRDMSSFYAEKQTDKRPVSDSMENHISRALLGELVVFERTLLNANGIAVPCEERLVILPSSGHRLLRASYVDITERKQIETEIRIMNNLLESRVKERTAQLERANQDLADISNSMAHSLRTPLRALDGFSQILLEENHQTLDEAGKEYLARIRAASRQMWQVTDGLVELLSVTRGDLKLDRVDLGELARGTLRDLQSAQPERQVEFVCGEGLNVKADAGMMRVLLGSLLGNAWKFSRERQPARIELGSLVEQGKTVYFVRDNGAGFDMAYIQKLFGVFQRLHAADQFEGNGVGLAMAQRIIRRHGGRIWAAAAVNQGATFYFTLQ